MPRAEPVAIVGIGCLFPGAPDLDAYWRAIVDATDAIGDVPDGHSWSADDYYDADHSVKDKTWCTRGGFLDAVPFDPVAFGIPPNQLESIDSAQLLALIVARETLRDAGIDPDGDGWDRERVACILGVTGTQELAISLGSRLQGPIWRRSLLRCGVDPDLADAIVADIGNHFPTWTEQSFPGLLGNVVAGRIANRLNLGGANAVVDAACASSLAAVQYAVSQLQSGHADMVLTGGSDTLNDIFMFECFTRTPAFSSKGDATPFDAAADGTLIGEGIAILAMKRLSDAERDGDRVYAVLKGIGSSSDGRFKSIYAPNPDGQAKALRRAYAEADVSPSTVELVEAHGTGTKAGDAVEITALTQVYREARPEGRWAAVGSVKSQIGHTKSTAGAAGLVKAALALHQRVLPPTAKVQTPNPRMHIATSPFYLPHEARPWVRAADHPRRAAVSAFGFGGSNFHAVLEEHGDDAVAAMGPAPAELFVVGADDRDGLLAALGAVDPDAPTLAHAARAVHTAWTPGSAWVAAFVASSADEAARLRDAAVAVIRDGGSAKGVHVGRDVSAPRLGVLFPGQGAQYVGMGRSLGVRHPALRRALDTADEAMRTAGRPPLSDRLFPPPARSDDARRDQAAALRATEWAQPALGAVELGMWGVLEAFGVTADATAGHSYGELVALRAAGVFDDAGLFAASIARGDAMAGEARGTMSAVLGPIERTTAVVEGIDHVVVANRNHPEQAVISGPADAVAAAEAALADAGLTTKRLQVSAAFHSPLVADARAPLADALASIPLDPPRLPVYANVTAAPYPEDADGIRALLAAQVVSPVDFVGVVDAMLADGVTVFVECGPRTVLTGLARTTAAAAGAEAVTIPLDPSKGAGDGDTDLKLALARLAAAGVPIRLDPLLAERLPAPPRRPGSRATVLIAGANHREPATLEPPMPELPKPVRPVVPPTAEADGWAAVPSSGAPIGKPPPLARSIAEEKTPLASPPLPTPPVPAPAPSSTRVAGGDLAALLDSTRATLQAFQASQERTARVHERFLEAAAKASESFTRLFDTHARLVELAATGQATPLPARAPLAAAPAGPPLVTTDAPVPPLPPLAPAATAEHTERLDPREAVERTVPSAPALWAAPDDLDEGRVASPDSITPGVATDLPPLFDAAAAVAGRTGEPAAPPVAGATADPAAAVGALKDAVAEKTGYPVDLLELEMDLEADLGVDSIKRVEILSAVRDRLPGLPELDNDAMAALRTLEEVADALTTSMPAAAPAGADTAGAVLDVVAEKTGYPREMLELGMDLEADLGIDSIKRVEILSAVTDRVPGLPSLDNDALGALRTLQEVVDALGGAAPADGVPVPALLRPPPTVDRGDVVDATFDAIATKTGYPRELLELEMDLEGDLGIDSIKRVEILSAVKERLPSLPEVDADAIAAHRTIGAVVDHLVGVGVGLGFAMVGAGGSTGAGPQVLELPSAASTEPVAPPAAPVVQSARELTQAHRGLQRRVLSFVPGRSGSRIPLDGPVLVTGSGQQAAAIADALRADGVDARLVQPAWTPEGVAAALAERPVGIVHAAALGAEGAALADAVRGGFLLARAAEAPTLFVTVTDQGGRFGHTGDRAPLAGALAGLAKTASIEWEDCACVAVDAATDAPAATIARVLVHRQAAVEVGVLADGTTVTPATSVVPLPTAPGNAPVDPGDLVVVSGGARGVTAAVVAEMAQRWKPALLLLGRSAVPDADPAWALGATDAELRGRYLSIHRDARPSLRELDDAVRAVASAREVRSTLATVRAAGATVTYAPVDVRDPAAVAGVVEAAVAEHGPVRGLVHGAGVLADKRIAEKSDDAFDRVFGTKVDGIRSLLGAVDPAELRMFAAFSSIAGRRGNAGQVDYAMANEVLTRHAARLAGAGVRAMSFDWGPWEGGMVTPSLRRHFEAAGHGLIPLHAGARAFCDELERGDAVEVVIEGPRPRTGTVRHALDPASPFLVDHRLDQRPVVPVAMVLEWIAEVAGGVYPAHRGLEVRDLQVLKGIVLDGPTAVTVTWSPVPGGLAFQVEGEPGPLGPTVHYRATVATTTVDGGAFPGSNGLGAHAFPLPLDEAYDRFLFHGPSLRGIESIEGMSDGGIVGWLRASEPSALGVDQPAWATDPVVVDSTLQLMVLWVQATAGVPALPSAIGAYTQFAPFPDRVACHLRMADAGPKRGRYAATLVDEQGTVIATLDGGEYTADPKLARAFRNGA